MKTQMPIIFAFSGRSNSGKTTLICKLCEHMQGYKIAIIKHDPKDKALFDREKKDSYEFFKRAQAVAVISPTRTTLQIKNENTHSMTNLLKQVLHNFKNYDYVFIEGLKTLPFPRIVVARETIEAEYIPYANAFAIDESVRNTDILPVHLPILPLNNIAKIIDFIHNYPDNLIIKGTH